MGQEIKLTTIEDDYNPIKIYLCEYMGKKDLRIHKMFYKDGDLKNCSNPIQLNCGDYEILLDTLIKNKDKIRGFLLS